jgi:hypothetical protein
MDLPLFLLEKISYFLCLNILCAAGAAGSAAGGCGPGCGARTRGRNDLQQVRQLHSGNAI